MIILLLYLQKLACSALVSLLQEAVPAITAVHSTQQFLELVSTSSQPRTVEAYSSGLEAVLHQFSGFLASLEGEVASQQATSSLLSVLARLRPWLAMIVHLASLHTAATGHFATSENWYKAVRILSVLYNALSTVTLQAMLPCVLDIFLR